MATTLYINELLSYSSHYINNSNIQNIKKIIVNFYDNDEVLTAKKLLWELKSDFLGPYNERKSTVNRSSSEANLNDIFDGLQTLDTIDQIPNFVAKNIDKIPERQPEEINIVSLLNRINKIEKKTTEYKNTLSNHEIDLHYLKSLDIDSKYNELRTLTLKNNSEMHENEKQTTENESDWETVDEIHTKPRCPNTRKRKKRCNLKNEIEKIIDIARKKSALSIKQSSSDKVKVNNERVNWTLSPLLSSSSTSSEPRIIDNEGFEQSETRIQRRKRMLRENKDNLITGAPPPIKRVYVGRIREGNCDSMKKYLLANKVRIEAIDLISHRDSIYKSFKISLIEPYLTRVLSHDFWPYGVICKEWIDVKNSSPNNQVKYNNLAFNKPNEYYNSRYRDNSMGQKF